MSIEVSKFVSYAEATRTSTGLKNDPTVKQLAAIRLLCLKVFDPLREWVGGPVKVNSVFRSKAVNTAVGGSSTSQHCANNGAAIDIDDTYKHKTNAEMFNYIKDNLEFDQLIWEFGTAKNPDWVHVSYKAKDNRKQILRAIKVKGKTSYVPYTA